MPSLTFIALCVVAAVAGPADGWTRGNSEGWGCEIGGTPTGTQRKQVCWSQEAVSEKPTFKTIKMKLMRVSPLPRTAPKDRAVAVSGVAEITPCSAAGIKEPQHRGTGERQAVQAVCSGHSRSSSRHPRGMGWPAQSSSSSSSSEGQSLKERYLQATISKRAQSSMRSLCWLATALQKARSWQGACHRALQHDLPDLQMVLQKSPQGLCKGS